MDRSNKKDYFANGVAENSFVHRAVADWQIRFGGGGFLSILDEIGVQLDASGASTTMGVMFFKFN